MRPTCSLAPFDPQDQTNEIARVIAADLNGEFATLVTATQLLARG